MNCGKVPRLKERSDMNWQKDPTAQEHQGGQNERPSCYLCSEIVLHTLFTGAFRLKSLPGRHQAFEFFKPVEDDVDLACLPFLFVRFFDHQESLPIG